MNMYKQYFYFYFSLIYYLVITSKKVNEYVKLKLPKDEFVKPIYLYI